MEKIKVKHQFRTMDISSGAIDEENRTVDLSFSSEKEVGRWFGNEILDHEESSVDLSRLNSSAAVLENHGGNQIGVVEKAEIKDKKGYAKIRFSKQGRGAEVFQDIVDNIVRNISFGYQINKLELEKEEKGKEPTYRSKSWMPLEISVVSVPADFSIGIGRGIADDGVEIEIEKRELEVEKTIPIEEEKTFCNTQEKILKLKSINSKNK